MQNKTITILSSGTAKEPHCKKGAYVQYVITSPCTDKVTPLLCFHHSDLDTRDLQALTFGTFKSAAKDVISDFATGFLQSF